MSLTASDLACLEGLIPGRVGEPGTRRYEIGRKVFSRTGRNRKPAAVLRPADRNDVAAIMRWASTSKTRISIRSGGHSFDGFPIRDGEVLLDLRDLGVVDLDASGRLHAMPGATIMQVARALDGSGRVLPTGDCPTVGLGGLVSGGGFGYATRHLGLTLDFLAEATVVTADGQILTANDTTNADLFWALRGGAGCVGVMTDLVLNTVPLERVTGMTLGWRWDAVDEAIFLFSRLMQTAPTELDLKLKIRTTGADRFIDEASPGPADAVPGTPSVHIDGQFLGHQDVAQSLMRPLLDHPAALNPTIREESYFDAMLQLVPLDLLNDPAPDTLRPTRVASGISCGELSEAEAGAIVRYIDAVQSAPDLVGGAVLIEANNGAVTATAPDETAYVHRRGGLLYEWELFGKVPADEHLTARHDALLRETPQRLANVLTGGRYVNYADTLDTPNDWWGDNVDRLTSIADRYDPEGILISSLLGQARMDNLLKPHS